MTFQFPEAALAAFTAVLGKTGSGKSSVAKLIVEQVVAAGSRVCILDPLKSDHWGLTSSADGKRAGLPFHILGGPHGHVPLHHTAGKAVAELVATGALPLSIIDMRDFEPGGLQRFFVDFAPALLRRQRGVLYLLIEEAHLFAPKEAAGVGLETLAIHHAKILATAGRSEGIRLIMATQRTQSLHNALLGSCETVVAMRLTLPADQKPVIGWLKANTPKTIAAEATGDLAFLPTGTGWLCSAAAGIFEKVAFPKIKTYDNSATPMGETEDRKIKRAPVDLEKLRSVIGDAVKEAEANDPKRLKARIAELEKQLARGPTAAAPAQPAADELATAEQRGYARGLEDGNAAGFENGRREALDGLAQIIDAERQPGGRGTLPPSRPVPAAASRPAAREAPLPLAGVPAERPPKAKAPSRPAAEPGAFNAAAQKMLQVLDTNPPVLRSWHAIATLAGLKARGGYFNTGKRGLLASGLVVEEGALVRIATPSAGAAAPVHDPAALIETWARILAGAAPKILRHLFTRPGHAFDRIHLAEDLGIMPRGGYWNTAWRELRDNNLVIIEGNTARLSDLFTAAEP